MTTNISKLLESLQEIHSRHELIAAKIDSSRAGWKLAIKLGDGESETARRAELHALMDQQLDLESDVHRLHGEVKGGIFKQ
jgi:hypothetical protein